MDDLRRHSPVRLPANAARTVDRIGWRVIRNYEHEAAENQLIDLSHRPRWDVQDPDPAAAVPSLPQEPGEAAPAGDYLVIRLNRTQAALWQLQGDETSETPTGPAFTDVSEATFLLALVGVSAGSVLEKLTALDLSNPGLVLPHVFQGPLCRVAVQLAVLQRSDAFLIAGARGYARDITEAILQAGEPYGLRPGGEAAFEPVIAGFLQKYRSRSKDHEH